MFTSILFTTVLASSATLLTQAIVVPDAPGPGDIFNQGATCHVSWAADDTGSTTAWKNMAIELMTGANEAMIHVTTITDSQDGSVAGVFDYTCPEVTPNSAIYFYQFTAPGTKEVTWTTRFTIAAADGSTTPPTETENDASGNPVGWGKGALVDPSSAVAAPTFNSTGSSSAGGSSASGGSSTAAPAGQTKASTTPSSTSRTPAKSGSSLTSAAAQTTGSSAAMHMAPMDPRMWPFVAAMVVSALSFTLLL